LKEGAHLKKQGIRVQNQETGGDLLGMRGKMGRPLLLKANVALAILLLARLGTCEAMMGTLGPLRAKRWGDGGQAGLLLHLRGGQASEDDVQRIEEMAEEMRKRIPDDEELQAVEEEARVDMSWRPGAAQALREELGSFQIDVEGADGRTSTAQGREEDAKEEEDLFGPAGLLRDFWRLEDGSSMGSRLLNKPSVPLPETKDAQQAGGGSAVGAAEFASAVRSANLGTFEAAELLPATCGADRVRAPAPLAPCAFTPPACLYLSLCPRLSSYMHVHLCRRSVTLYLMLLEQVFGLPLVEEADDAQLKEAAAGDAGFEFAYIQSMSCLIHIHVHTFKNFLCAQTRAGHCGYCGVNDSFLAHCTRPSQD
jgi:hypothetical protein